MLRLMSVLVLGSVVAGQVGEVRAEERLSVEGDTAPTPVDDGDQVRVILGLQTGGAGGLAGYDGGFEAGLSLDLRTAPITAGLTMSMTVDDIFERNLSQYAMHVGHTFHFGDALAFDVLGEFGLRSDQANDGLLSGDPGTSVENLFLGARLNLDYALTNPRAVAALRIGVSTFFRVDLESAQEVSYEYEDCFFTCDTETTTHRAGGNTDLGVLFTLAADFGG